jgi:hypothetical protein
VNDGLKIIRNEKIVAYFKVEFQNSLRGPESPTPLFKLPWGTGVESNRRQVAKALLYE